MPSAGTTNKKKQKHAVPWMVLRLVVMDSAADKYRSSTAVRMGINSSVEFPPA